MTAVTAAVGIITKSDVPAARCWLIPSRSVMPGTRIAAPPMPSSPLRTPVVAPIMSTAGQHRRRSIASPSALLIGQAQPLAQSAVDQTARPPSAQDPADLVERLRAVQLDGLARVDGHVRCQDHVLQVDERVVGLYRLGLEDVESGA